MTLYQKGDVVECVDASSSNASRKGLLTQGEKYIIQDSKRYPWVTLEGAPLQWSVSRFKKVEQEMPKKTPHVHAELIKAWADGHHIQCLRADKSGTWLDTPVPNWNPELKFRIKPDPKPDVVIDRCIEKVGDNQLNGRNQTRHKINNCRFIFDGETGKLKAVELIK